MKNFLLILLGKEINKSVNDSIDGVFKSECYYDWIKLKNISSKKDGLDICPEDLLVASYDEEIKERQEAISNGVHVQQGIIAIPADDTIDEDEYEKFYNKIKKTGIIFISFISIPSWSHEEQEMISSVDTGNANEQVKRAIIHKLNTASMRLFYTFDHNDFAIICDGEKTKLEDYLKVLAEIKATTLANEFRAVHDITTIYGYKGTVDSENKINAVISISGQDVNDDISDLRLFTMETIGRYDHLSGYKNITWSQLASISKKLHDEHIITSRVHIGCSGQNEDQNDYSKRSFPLFEKFKSAYQCKIEEINFDKLSDLYGDDEYIASIKVMLYEIGFAISITLQRGFSKYNSICYIESYLCFLDYIKEKIVNKFCTLLESRKDDKYDNIKNLAEILVDVSNSFYKSILTLDSSIMHSERRFIMSDPYQLSLFDVPPKLIAYYTAVASKMAKSLNVQQDNKYVFLITPDIKKDIYVESITENRDIGSEINILVIHINERNIYNVTDTIKILSHEIAHHVGQNSDLRKERAVYFIKCYIALLLKNSLDPDLFLDEYEIDQILASIENIVDKIYKLVESSMLSKFFNRVENYYYMDELQYNIHSILIENLKKISEIDTELYSILSTHLSTETLKKYLKKSKVSFVDIDNTDIENDRILKEYTYRLILENTYSRLTECVNKSKDLEGGLQNIRFIFKEGYADMQMLLLTQNPELKENDIAGNYSATFNNITDNADEIMRKCAVINAFLDREKQNYEELLEVNKIKDCNNNLYKAYLIYICKQAALYFLKVKSSTASHGRTDLFDNIFDCSTTSLFKKSNMSEIISCMDSAIDSYIEGIC